MKKVIFLFGAITLSLSLMGQDRLPLSRTSNGFTYQYYEDGKPLMKEQFVAKIATDPIAFQHWQNGKTIDAVVITGSIIGGGLLGWGLGLDRNYSEAEDLLTTRDETLILAGAGTAIAALLINFAGNAQYKKAIFTYNQSAPGGTTYIGPTRHGLGLTLTF